MPEANWAIAVIVKHDPSPVDRLKRITKYATVEGGVMSLLAIKAVDKAVFDKLADEWNQKTKNDTSPVDIFSGCILGTTTARVALGEVNEWEAGEYLHTEIPALEETVRLKRRTPEEFAELARKRAEHRKAKDEAIAAGKK